MSAVTFPRRSKRYQSVDCLRYSEDDAFVCKETLTAKQISSNRGLVVSLAASATNFSLLRSAVRPTAGSKAISSIRWFASWPENLRPRVIDNEVTG
jgi:hypothetical protein